LYIYQGEVLIAIQSVYIFLNKWRGARVSHKVSALYFFNVVVLFALLIARAATSMDSLHHCEAVSTLNGQLWCRSGINMTSPLSICTKEKQHAVIQFLWAEGVPGEEIYRRFSAQYGNSALPQCSVNGLPCSKTAAQVSVMMNNLDAHPHLLQKRTLNKSML
jgi:hypothetical protein